MKSNLFCALLVGSLLFGSVAECRVGGGRSFGYRGSRGFSSPSGFRNSPYRNAPNPQQPYQQQAGNPTSPLTSPSQPNSILGSSFTRSFGAGLAGSFIGNMLFRSFGGGGYPYPGGESSRGGIGLIEILLIAGLLYLLFKFWMTRSQKSAAPNNVAYLRQPQRSENSENLFQSNSDFNQSSERSVGHHLDIPPINTDVAMDLFFQIQGAWGNRDLTSVKDILDTDAKAYLEQEVGRLKAAKQINRLENIAVRNTEVVEAWKDTDKEYSSVQFTANLLDFTVNEQTFEIVSGSKTTPVKFKELWTFSKESGSNHWKLAAIMQS